MKKQLLIAAAMLSMAALSAQEIIYEQDFEGDPEELFDEGWYLAAINGGENYGIFNATAAIQNIGFQGNAIGATTFDIVNQIPVHIPDADFIIVTPVIDLPEGNVNLSYRVGSLAVGGGAGSHYSVYVITQSDMQGLMSDEDMRDMLDGKTPTDTATVSGQSSVLSYSIEEYSGQPVAIAFRLHDTAANTALLFDDIAVTMGTMGIDDVQATQFLAYPNPITDLITVAASDNSVIEAVSVTDLNGRIVINKQFSGLNTAQLDLSGLSSGVYLMSVSSDKGTLTKKIVKQ